jgi:hypothetical protein
MMSVKKIATMTTASGVKTRLPATATVKSPPW